MNTKKILTIVIVAALVFTFPAIALAKGPGGGGGGGGGGGHTEPVGNNLSFPVIWAEGIALPLRGVMEQATLTVPYYDYQIDCGGGVLAYPYAQKIEGNVWQAENLVIADATPVIVNEIDWGDSLESVDMKVGRPVRVELSLYKTQLETPMTAFNMVMLANPSSPDEVQGACATELNNGATALVYESTEATVYSPYSKVVIQKITGTNLTWAGTQWIGDAEAPVAVTFAGELNVGGKVIFGLSQGGWKPTSTGDYRITFYLPLDKNTIYNETTIIRISAEAETITAEEEGGDVGGEAYVDWMNNLTYIDVTVVGGGGGKRP